MIFSFDNIQQCATKALVTPLFTHFQNNAAPFMYAENFIQFHQVPTLADFIDALAYLKSNHAQNGQRFIKVVWPEDHEIPQDIISHLGSNDFSLDVLELYAATPETFIPTREASPRSIQVDWVKDTNRDGYLTVSASGAREVSEAFAEQKLPITLKKFTSAGFHPIVAVVEGQAAGSIDLYITDDTIEIDSFYVLPSFRRKGIGTALQEFVMAHADGRTVLLVADASDTAREMYNRQNYTYLSFRYELLKLL